MGSPCIDLYMNLMSSPVHYDAMTAMVESWREELYTMIVKNSILLDDLVILGADS
jgi:hypothetical protein